MPSGGTVSATLYLHGDTQINGYWKFSEAAGWYDFAYDGSTSGHRGARDHAGLRGRRAR
ncbi:MAG: hypothetical protein R2873_27520 [Caldilineaceae bacterium]